jgi:hypothetical protein
MRSGVRRIHRTGCSPCSQVPSRTLGVTTGSTALDPEAPATDGVPGRDPLPIYPVTFVIAWMVALLGESTAAVHALPRPLVFGAILVVIALIAFTLFLRNRHLAAILVLLVEMTLIGLGAAALLVGLVIAVSLAMDVRRRRPIGRGPWWVVTHGLNLLTVILLGIVLTRGFLEGTLSPPERLGPAERGPIQEGLPDIYLVLLDGYPRSDTLARDFGYDDTLFLETMGGLGFTTASESHSNYNGTELTLASMLNVAHVADLPEVADHQHTPQGQSRVLTRAINQGRALDALRGVGYEIVTAPSEYSSVTLYDADRTIAGGEISSFELEILQQGTMREILPDLQRSWLSDQHRARLSTTFETLGALAAERTGHPRFVLAHLLAPHAPVVFGPHGEPRDGWPCFPTACSIFYGGQAYGGATLPLIRDEIEYLDVRIQSAAEQILARSERPPVIIFFSDHGSRHDFDDSDEMLRSFFVASTPGRPGLFPEDVTPINIIPRLLNAYAGTNLSMATEESYVVDMRTVETSGMLNLTPWPAPDP